MKVPFMQINGEYKTVSSALFQLSSSLRNELSSRGTHNEMRTGSPYLRVNGTDSSVLYQPIGTSPKATEQADITHQMNQLGLSRSNGTFSPRLQQSQVFNILSPIFKLSLYLSHSKLLSSVKELQF